VTKGREIENYLPATSVSAGLSIPLDHGPVQYESFREYLNHACEGSGDGYVENKVQSVERILPHLDKTQLEKCLDLDQQMVGLIESLCAWNRIPQKGTSSKP